LVDACYRRYREGFVTKRAKGRCAVPVSKLGHLFGQVCGESPISLRRIDRYDGQQVTYHYRPTKASRSSGKRWRSTRLSAHDSACVSQRISTDPLLRGAKPPRRLPSSSTCFKRPWPRSQVSSRAGDQNHRPMTYRQRYHQSTGRRPLALSHCHSDMGVWRIWHPSYGVIHDELEAMRRGK